MRLGIGIVVSVNILSSVSRSEIIPIFTFNLLTSLIYTYPIHLVKVLCAFSSKYGHGTFLFEVEQSSEYFSVCI